MTQATYQHDYREDLKGEGREICISDGTISYYYDFPAGDTLQDAVDNFAATYDFGDSTEPVRITAEEYRDGEHVDTLEDTIETE